jgi:hypothetical protein
MDTQSVMSSIETLLSLHGWVAAHCPTLIRPFGQNSHEHVFDDLLSKNHLYFVGIVIHSADHFLVDQLAVIVQLAKRFGPSRLFVSMLDYDSSDSTATLTDLSEAVLTLLGIPYRIRRVPGMTVDPTAAYYPAEEAYMRNLALEPLKELYERRKIKFHRVIWLKGFTCPNDILETIKVSDANDAAMVCGMDWAEHNGAFIFSDRYAPYLLASCKSAYPPIIRWRTRDINGDQFRQSKSSSKPDAVPPRDRIGAARYSQHLPFQVFCCESGTHVVDPAQSYYMGISYRAGTDFHNVSLTEVFPERAPDAPCLDSSQAWFCRDLWLHKAREGVQEMDARNSPVRRKRTLDDEEVKGGRVHRLPNDADPDANAGSDYDAMPDSDVPDEGLSTSTRLSIPNSLFRPARILVNHGKPADWWACGILASPPANADTPSRSQTRGGGYATTPAATPSGSSRSQMRGGICDNASPRQPHHATSPPPPARKRMGASATAPAATPPPTPSRPQTLREYNVPSR